MSRDVVGCQFSVYPLRQPEIGQPIREAVEAARAQGCNVRVGNLSTLMWGDEDQVFGALRAAFRAAQRTGSSVVIATLAAGIPTDELVNEIQAEVEGSAMCTKEGRK
jgi:uncharacterized protein YqgV (UPF0045/DUF77 family)